MASRTGLLCAPYLIPASCAAAIIEAASATDMANAHTLQVTGYTSENSASAGCPTLRLASSACAHPPSSSSSGSLNPDNTYLGDERIQPNQSSAAPDTVVAPLITASIEALTGTSGSGAFVAAIRLAESKRGAAAPAATAAAPTSTGSTTPLQAAASSDLTTKWLPALISLVLGQPCGTINTRDHPDVRSAVRPLDEAVLRRIYMLGQRVDVRLLEKIRDFDAMAVGPWLRDSICRLCEHITERYRPRATSDHSSRPSSLISANATCTSASCQKVTCCIPTKTKLVVSASNVGKETRPLRSHL